MLFHYKQTKILHKLTNKQKYTKLIAWILLINIINVLPVYGFHSQFIVSENEFEKSFLSNIDSTSDTLSALIASGVEPQNYALYQSEIERWHNEIQDTLPSNASQTQIAENVGFYLHDKVYSKYKLSATTLKEVFDTGHFNCLSATIIMMILLRSFGINTRSIILPTHVYTLATLDGKNTEIENTMREGLAISQDKQIQERFNRLTGFSYNKNQEKVIIDWKSTLGLLYSNRSYFDAEKNRHIDAFQNMIKAQIFLSDVKSEERNLIAGYLNYSYFIYKKNNAPLEEYLKTLSILEEGIQRFPTYQNLQGNYLKGIDIVLNKMIQSKAKVDDLENLINTSQNFLSKEDFQKLQKSYYIRTSLNLLHTNKNFADARSVVKQFWEKNKNDKDAQNLIQEYTFTIIKNDLEDQRRVVENTSVLNLVKEFPTNLTSESLACYYSGLAKNNFAANRFEESVQILKKGRQVLGDHNLVVQNGFIYAVNSAQHFLNQKDTKNAIEFYKKALEFKSDRNVINNIGILYQQLIAQYRKERKNKEAEDLIQESIKIVPNHPALQSIHRNYI